ncbi:hypothetical protein [Streptomyces qinglanensis]|uniref:Uncharacterized protein n=1 Tax=Streptomyces qinglanensis TaxID=943816 RepID=A0A1H9SE15_9ACTN|nr:hypothetical protein [Streptomyces qinglanensis]SER83148.1 hypothetical protein SAMN05421870_104464 [Streptomyces qinglanensis]
MDVGVGKGAAGADGPGGARVDDPAQTTCGAPTPSPDTDAAAVSAAHPDAGSSAAADVYPPAGADADRDASGEGRSADPGDPGEDSAAGCREGSGDGSGDGFAQVRAVADAICYEGYLLYPYRRSSPKNRVRWQFGVLAPRAWAEVHGSGQPGVSGAAESWYQQTHCLCDAAPDAVLRVRVRYLQAQYKSVQRRTGADGAWEPVEALDVDGELHLSFEEAVPREADIEVPVADLLAGQRSYPVGAPGGTDTARLAIRTGPAARTERRRLPVRARTTLRAERLGGPAGPLRLTVRTENTDSSVPASAPREEALRSALLATHTLLGGDGLEFHSLIDPPARARPHAADCRNEFTFPVLAGDERVRSVLFSSPILLDDHPRIAPESPGDLHDAAEIDEILSLRTFLLTDEEKREARATDPRAAAILDQVESMPEEVLAGLHGAIRSLEPAAVPAAPAAPAVPAAPPGPVPWWQEGGDEGVSPTTDSVLVDGVPVRSGHRVRLRPRRRGADAHDMFLVDRTAHVAGVFHDVDGSMHLAVTLDDDPAAELHDWYGRYHYFRPDEVRPLADGHREVRPPTGSPPGGEAG